MVRALLSTTVSRISPRRYASRRSVAGRNQASVSITLTVVTERREVWRSKLESAIREARYAARGAMGADVSRRVGGGVRRLPGALPSLRHVRTAWAAVRRRAGRAEGACDLRSRRARTRRHRGPCRPLAHP